MRRHKLDKHPDAKREIVKSYTQGKTLREIYKDISVSYPNVETSVSGIHRFIKSIKPFLKLKEAGLLEEDIDLILNSQELLVFAKGLISQVIADWVEKGEIDAAKVDVALDIIHGLERVSRASAYVQRTKEDIAVKTGEIFKKLYATLNKHLQDNPELVKKILKELEDEL